MPETSRVSAPASETSFFYFSPLLVAKVLVAEAIYIDEIVLGRSFIKDAASFNSDSRRSAFSLPGVKRDK